jgi:hypothetical protein
MIRNKLDLHATLQFCTPKRRAQQQLFFPTKTKQNTFSTYSKTNTMEATRFRTIGSWLAVFGTLVVLMAQTSFAQVVALPISANSNTQFGRLSWYANLTTLMGANFTFTGNTAFGVYGQTNTAQGFGIFGSSQVNGGYGGAAMSHTGGGAINRGFWALASNKDPSNQTASTYRSIALELGANEFALTGYSGLAILVDSGDVKLGTLSNTTYVNNLTITGTVVGLTGNNRFTQANTGDKVIIDSSTAAAVHGIISGSGNTDPVFLGTSAGVGYLFKGDATGGGGLLDLAKSGTSVFNVNSNGQTTINPTATSGTSLGVTGSNTTGFTTNLTNTASTNWASGLSAALNVTHGAIIDSLKVPGAVNFNNATVNMINANINMDSADVTLRNGTLDLTNTTVTGLSGNNKFHQNVTSGLVDISASTAAGIEVQMGDGINMDPAILVNDSTNATGALLDLRKNNIAAFRVNNNGSLVIAVDSQFLVNATNGNTNTKGTLHADGDFSVGTVPGTNGLAVTALTGATALNSSVGTGYAMSITNTSTAAGAMSVLATNNAAFGTTITRSTPSGNFSTHKADTANAALSVTRGAFIDTLNIGGYLGFKRDGNATADFTNVNVIGFTANDTNAVRFHPSAAQSNTVDRPSIWINQNNPSGVTPILQLQNNGTNVFTVGDSGNVAITNLSTVNPALTVNAQADGKTAIVINGGVQTGSYPNQPAGTVTGAILQGLRSVTLPVLNSLVTANSQIVVSAESTAGDSYTATVVLRTSGTGFSVKVTCVEGDVYQSPSAAVTVHYWITN